MIRFATGVDLITNAVRAAVGEEVSEVEQRPYKGYWAEVVLHADTDGHFIALDIDEEFYHAHVRQTDLWVKQGDRVSAFRGANDAIGTLVLEFKNDKEMLTRLKSQKEWLKIRLNNNLKIR